MSKHKSDPKQTTAPAAPATETDPTTTEPVEQPIAQPMDHHSPLDDPNK